MSVITEQQVIAQGQECPICMEQIETLCNRVLTECGHAFHCSCLMKNTSHNGFSCPYCRTKMAEEPKEEYYEEYEYDSDIPMPVFEEHILTAFRMFHQQINGEEVEEEPTEAWETYDEDEEEDEEPDSVPDAAYISQKLIERGITIEDLVKNILFQEHSNWGQQYIDYERRSSEVYGQFRAVIARYTPQERHPALTEHVVPVPSDSVPSDSVPSDSVPSEPPAVAESKSKVVSRRREFMVHV